MYIRNDKFDFVFKNWYDTSQRFETIVLSEWNWSNSKRKFKPKIKPRFQIMRQTKTTIFKLAGCEKYKDFRSI